MTPSALLILDTQQNMFADDFHVANGSQILANIAALIAKAQAANAKIIYIRNNGGAGDPDEPGTPGWEIHPAIAPQADDMVVDKATADAFDNTTLQSLLDGQGITGLVVAGMQTEVCITETCQTAVNLGYRVTLAADAHTTFDWEEMIAADAIAQAHNLLAPHLTIQPTQEIVF